MPIPNYRDKYGADALFSPEDALDAQGEGVPDVPPAIILGLQQELTDAIRADTGDPVPIVRSQRYYPLTDRVGYVPVHEWGIGAPVAATVTENVVAAGAEAVVLLSGCAALRPHIPPDAAVLPTSAVRDEGASYHYVPPDEPVEPASELVDELDGRLSAAGFETPRGPTWTTSAMYRETIPEIHHYRDEGVVSLCMESSAVWAVCKYRGVNAATVHEIGDYLLVDEWDDGAERSCDLPAMLAPTVEAVERYVG